jgi:hypothetical protein
LHGLLHGENNPTGNQQVFSPIGPTKNPARMATHRATLPLHGIFSRWRLLIFGRLTLAEASAVGAR